MRIITGSARGTKLETLDGLETRPTQERVKEAVFSMIQFELENTVFLDLFAGSGQMGLEALSRGAKCAVFVENNPDAMAVVKKNAHKTRLYDKAKFVMTDYKDYLRTAKGRFVFDVVYLDPPYKADLIGEIISELDNHSLLGPNGIIICESEKETEYASPGFFTEKHNRYGRAYITLLRKKQEELK